jgi:hypothetical protein
MTLSLLPTEQNMHGRHTGGDSDHDVHGPWLPCELVSFDHRRRLAQRSGAPPQKNKGGVVTWNLPLCRSDRKNTDVGN